MTGKQEDSQWLETIDKSKPTICIIGKSGLGKTTLFNKLTGLSKLTGKGIRGEDLTIYPNIGLWNDINVIDLPGYNEYNETWWEMASAIHHVNLTLILVNATDRLSDLGTFRTVIDAIKAVGDCLIMALPVREFATIPEYETFEMPPQTQEFPTELLKVGLPYTIISPTNLSKLYRKLFKDYNKVKQELVDQETIVLQITEQKAYHEALAIERNHKLSQERERASNAESTITQEKQAALQARTDEQNAWQLLSNMYERRIDNLDGALISLDEIGSLLGAKKDGKYVADKWSKARHIGAWLPFAGNYHMEMDNDKIDKLTDKLNSIIIRIEAVKDSIERPVKPTSM